MRFYIGTTLGLWLMLAGNSFAQSVGTNIVVVELYTSQGCSSCPPADAVLAKLAKREDVLALAMHVDYWDYIGWKDTLADPAYTKRQRAYAKVAGARTVYTPQMIIGGMDHIMGARPANVDSVIRTQAKRKPQVRLTVTSAGTNATLRASALTALPQGAIVQLVRYDPSETVAIGRGENAGRTIDYVNTVKALDKVANWDGKSDLDLVVKTEGNGLFAVIIQEPGPGRVLAAARVR